MNIEKLLLNRDFHIAQCSGGCDWEGSSTKEARWHTKKTGHKTHVEFITIIDYSRIE